MASAYRGYAEEPAETAFRLNTCPGDSFEGEEIPIRPSSLPEAVATVCDVARRSR